VQHFAKDLCHRRQFVVGALEPAADAGHRAPGISKTISCSVSSSSNALPPPSSYRPSQSSEPSLATTTDSSPSVTRLAPAAAPAAPAAPAAYRLKQHTSGTLLGNCLGASFRSCDD
jgi:hypothetical protein